MDDLRRWWTATQNTSSAQPGIHPGDTIAGSQLYYVNTIHGGTGYPSGLFSSISLGSGTWKALNFINSSVTEGVIRISGTNFNASPSVFVQRIA